MATYYGYVERNAEHYIDWASAANGITDMLDEQVKAREEKRKAIDDDFRKNYLELAKNPMGQITTLNQKSLQLAGQSQEIMLKLQKDLKSGNIKLNDYIRMKQNIIDSVSGVYQTIKEKNEMSKEVFDNMQNGTSSPWEYQTFMNLEGMEDLNNMYWNFDAEGMLWIAPKEKKIVDGQEVWGIPENPAGNYQPIAQIMNGIKFRRKAYDFDARTTAIVDGLGKYVEELETLQATAYKTGTIEKFEDVTRNPDFLKAKEQYLNGELADELAIGDILIKNVGVAPNRQAYYIEYDPKKAAENPAAILARIVNGKPVVVTDAPYYEEQRKIAFDKLNTAFIIKLDKQRTIQKTNQLDNTAFQEDMARKKFEEEKKNNAATRRLQGAQATYYENGGGTNPNAPSSPGIGYNATNYSNYLGGNLNKNLLVKEDPDATMANLNNKFSKFGFSFTDVSEGTRQRVLVRGLGNATTIIDLDNINDNSVPQLRAFMEDPSNINQARVAEQVGKKYD